MPSQQSAQHTKKNDSGFNPVAAAVTGAVVGAGVAAAGAMVLKNEANRKKVREVINTVKDKASVYVEDLQKTVKDKASVYVEDIKATAQDKTVELSEKVADLKESKSPMKKETKQAAKKAEK